MHLLLSMLLLWACGGGVPTTVDDCNGLSPGDADACLGTVLPLLFRQDRAQAEELTASRVHSSLVRDYIWLTVTRDVDPRSYRWCDRIEDGAMAERCRALVSRPHLHRALLGETEVESIHRVGGKGGPPPQGEQGTPPPPR
jgi:hypothetical protein